jgi:hypothetical protein
MTLIQGIGMPFQRSKIGWFKSFMREGKRGKPFFRQASLLGDMEGKKWPGIPQSSNTSTVLASKIKDK